MALDYLQQINEAASYIQKKITGLKPEIALILGSGLGDLADQITNPVKISYRDHYYEGYEMRTVTLPVYVMKQLGAKSLVITNAAGGMNRSFRAGDLMLISDHLNMTGANPLIGSNQDELGVRFPDMSEAYNREYCKLAHQVASEIKDQDDEFKLQEGVYAGISGPAYMTPAELTMLARLGGDAVGMSTVSEVIVARHCGLKVLGISCITDMAIGEELSPLTHEQVMATAERTKPKFIALVRGFIARLQ
jgi:purine-nucleoside phosphorylase